MTTPVLLGNQAINTDLEVKDNSSLPLALPTGTMLAKFLVSRVQEEETPRIKIKFPSILRDDLRPHLPKAGSNAMWLYSNRKKVQDYQLLFLTMALANPN